MFPTTPQSSFSWVLMVWTCWLFQISVPQTAEEFERVDGGLVLTRYRLRKFMANEGKSTLAQIKGFQKVQNFLAAPRSRLCPDSFHQPFWHSFCADIAARVARRRVWGAQALSKVADKFHLSRQRSFIGRETGNEEVTSMIKAGKLLNGRGLHMTAAVRRANQILF